VVLWATNETTDGYDLRFYSSEYTTDPTKQPKLEITYSTELKTVYFLKDHLGSVRATVLDSATAPVIGYDDYDPWGYPLAQRTKAIPNAYLQGASKNKFTGMEYDDDNGLNWVYFDWRRYIPEIGRWTSPDPLGQKHPEVTPYNYVLNNPMILVDPDGRQVKFGQLPAGSFLYAGMAAGQIKETLKYAASTVLACPVKKKLFFNTILMTVKSKKNGMNQNLNNIR